jgi:hypothetical protein
MPPQSTPAISDAQHRIAVLNEAKELRLPPDSEPVQEALATGSTVRHTIGQLLFRFGYTQSQFEMMVNRFRSKTEAVAPSRVQELAKKQEELAVLQAEVDAETQRQSALAAEWQERASRTVWQSRRGKELDGRFASIAGNLAEAEQALANSLTSEFPTPHNFEAAIRIADLRAATPIIEKAIAAAKAGFAAERAETLAFAKEHKVPANVWPDELKA